MTSRRLASRAPRLVDGDGRESVLLHGEGRRDPGAGGERSRPEDADDHDADDQPRAEAAPVAMAGGPRDAAPGREDEGEDGHGVDVGADADPRGHGHGDVGDTSGTSSTADTQRVTERGAQDEVRRGERGGQTDQGQSGERGEGPGATVAGAPDEADDGRGDEGSEKQSVQQAHPALG